MQEVWREINSNSSIYSKLCSFGVRSLRSRECGPYEASDLLLGDHLTEKSVTVKWVDAAMPQKRKRRPRLKSHKKLVEFEKLDPSSTDILEGSMVDIFYLARPKDLENVCLYHCAKNWVYAIGYFAYISSLRIKNPTCGMNQFRTVHISSILNRITCA